MAYDPCFTITPDILRILEAINHLHERILGTGFRTAWVPSLHTDALTRTIHGSTAIEGNPLSLKDVRMLVEGKPLPQAPRRSIQEIENYLEALKYIEKNSHVHRLEGKHILKIHALLGKEKALERGPYGSYRPYGVRVGDHIAPLASEVPRCMDDLLEWVNGDSRKWPAVVSSAVLHFRFEWIHPFGDGNGRAGRAMALWELYRREFEARHIFAIDEILWENRSDYYAALAHTEQDPKQDLTGWITFIARACRTALERAWKRLEEESKKQNRRSLVPTPNQQKLLALLAEKPMGIAEIQKALGVTKPGAHHILKPLLKAKRVRREGGHKTGVYRLV